MLRLVIKEPQSSIKEPQVSDDTPLLGKASIKINLVISSTRTVVLPSVDSHISIIDLARKHPPPGWFKEFQEADGELQSISQILVNHEKNNGLSFPLREHIFSAFWYTPKDQVKVVIWGQDPYPRIRTIDGLPQAQGLSFSVAPHDNIPPSLRTIYQELENEYPQHFARPNHGDLRKWARQGVLLLNSSLTVTPERAGSQIGLWQGFISHIVKAINESNPQVLHVLWGKEALKLHDLIGERVKIITSGHPSTLARNAKDPFLGNNHFRLINEHLTKAGKEPIDWRL